MTGNAHTRCRGGALNIGCDSGSCVTIDIMLHGVSGALVDANTQLVTEPDKGGEFETLETDGSVQQHRCTRADASVV